MFVFGVMQKKTWLVAVITLLLCGSSLYFPVLGAVGFVGVMALLLLRLKAWSLIESTALAILTFFIALISFYSIVTVCDLHLSVRYAPFILFAMLLVASVKQLVTWATPDFKLFNRTDAYALIAALTCLFYMLFPIYHLGGDKIAQFLSYGEDNASHYALTNYAYQHGNFAYHTQSGSNGIYKSLEIYPQGFHITAAVSIAMVKPLSVSAPVFVKLYAFFIAFIYSFFTFWMVKAGFSLIRKRSFLLELAILPGYFLLVAFGYPLLLLDRGFQSQIFTYLFVFAIFFVSFVQKPKTHRIRMMILSLLVVLTIGIASSWWLLLPLAAICIFYYIIKSFSINMLWNYVRNYWYVILACIFVILYPIAVNILLNQKVSPLNEPGGVNNIPPSIFYYMAPIILAGSIFVIRNLRHYTLLIVTWLGSLLSVGTIWLYQQITIGELRYFFYKSVYTFLLFTLMLSLVATIELVQWLTRNVRWAQYSAALLLVVVTSFLAVRSNLVFIKVYTHNWFPNAVQPTDLSVLFDSDTKNFKDILFVGGCQPGRAYLANRWSGARLLSEGPAHTRLELAGLDGKHQQVHDILRNQYKSDSKYKIVVFTDCPQAISGISNMLSSRYTVLAEP